MSKIDNVVAIHDSIIFSNTKVASQKDPISVEQDMAIIPKSIWHELLS